MTSAERSELLEEALRRSRQEFARNGPYLWSKLGTVALVPTLAVAVGWGAMTNQLENVDERSRDNQELLTEVHRTTTHIDFRVRSLERDWWPEREWPERGAYDESDSPGR